MGELYIALPVRFAKPMEDFQPVDTVPAEVVSALITEMPKTLRLIMDTALSSQEPVTVTEIEEAA